MQFVVLIQGLIRTFVCLHLTDIAQNKRRMHCWVYVASGRRDIKEPLFIEPTTGRAYSLHTNPYMGVESVWNNVNFWVNLQFTQKVSEVSDYFAYSVLFFLHSIFETCVYVKI